jgi:ferredoxin
LTYIVNESCIKCKLMDCVEVCPCPVDAIKPDTEPGAEKWLKLNADYAKTWPNITVKRDPPADSKEWEGKPDKLKYFSPNPGAGD